MRKYLICIFLVIIISISGCTKSEDTISTVTFAGYLNTLCILANSPEGNDTTISLLALIDKTKYYSEKDFEFNYSYMEEVNVSGIQADISRQLRYFDVQTVLGTKDERIVSNHSDIVKYYEDYSDVISDYQKYLKNGSDQIEKLDRLKERLIEADRKLYILSRQQLQVILELALVEGNALDESYSLEVGIGSDENGEEYQINYFNEEELEFSDEVSIAKSVFDTYIASESFSEYYNYLVVGKCVADDRDYIVVQAGTPDKMLEYYIIDLYNNMVEDENGTYVEPLVYWAGWAGINADEIEPVFKHDGAYLP